MCKNANYQNTVIYKIVCNDLDVKYTYVGHTTDFVRRKSCHKTCCNNPNDKHYNYKVYQTIRDQGGWENWCMVLVEKYPCNNGNEARARERFYYELLNADMNSEYPNRSKREYSQINAEHFKELHKKYRKENADQIREQRKQYYKENIESISEKYKKYYEANRNIINEKRRQYNAKKKAEKNNQTEQTELL